MAYNTGNPIGSLDPRDAADNKENFERFALSTERTYTDRLGVQRKTLAGMEQDFQQFLINSGYQFLGDYAAGIEVTAYNQVIRDGGEFWRVAAGTILPYTTIGAGMPEGGAFVSVGNAVLRQDLADPDEGAAMVALSENVSVRRALDELRAEFKQAASFGFVSGVYDEVVNAAMFAYPGEVRFKSGDVILVGSPIAQADHNVLACHGRSPAIVRPIQGYTGRLHDTTGRVSPGLNNIEFDGLFQAESLVLYTNCIAPSVPRGIFRSTRVENANSYRGALFFVNCTAVTWGDIEIYDIQQNPALGAGGQAQHHALVVDNCNGARGGNLYGERCDKLYLIAGANNQNITAARVEGKDIGPNGVYILGALNVGGIGEVYLDGVGQVLELRTSNPNTKFTIGTITAKNVTSRCLGLRQGGGLTIGSLIAEDAYQGISDVGFDGSVDVTIGRFVLNGQHTERALTLTSGAMRISIGEMIVNGSNPTGETARIGGAADNITIGKLIARGGPAVTLRLDTPLSSGNVRVDEIDSDAATPIQAAGGFQNFPRFKSHSINGHKFLGTGSASLITGTTLTVNQGFHQVDTDGSATQNIDTIAGGMYGCLYVFRSVSNVRDPIFEHGTGNIRNKSAANVRLNATTDIVTYFFDGTNFIEV